MALPGRSLRLFVLACAVGAALPASPALAQDAPAPPTDAPPIAADRPGLSDPPTVLARGVIQVEIGVTAESAVDATTLVAPQTVLRMGLGRGVEARIGSDGLVSEVHAHVRHTGRADLTAGLKIRLVRERRGELEIAMIPAVSLPAGSAAFSSGAVDPSLTLAWQHMLPAGLQAGGNVAVSASSDGAGRVWQRGLAGSLGRDLVAGWAAFAEVSGTMPAARAGGGAWTVDAGVTRLIGRHLQLDASAGRSVSAGASAWFVSAGIAVRHVPRPRTP